MPFIMMAQVIEKLDRIEHYLLARQTADPVLIFKQVFSQIGTDEMNRLLDILQTTVAPQQDQERVLPEHVTTEWVMSYLDVSRATFYRSIRDKLLTSVLQVGNRPYYLKQDVVGLMAHHEKGSWTFAKMSKRKALENATRPDSAEDP